MKRIPLHSLLIMLYSVLFLFAENIAILKTEDLWRPLGVVSICTVLVFLIYLLVFRHLVKAGIATTGTVLLFFGYGHYFDLLYSPNKELLNLRFKYDVYIWVSIILCLSMLLGLYRSKANFTKLNSLLNFISVILIVTPAYKISAHSYSQLHKHKAISDTVPEINMEGHGLNGSDSLPSVYYLIMDAYGRNDVLLEYFGFDNTEFTDQLNELGFYVADQSLANYNKTILSIPSALNMDYVDDLASELGPKSRDEQPLIDLIDNNRTIRHLKQFGYSLVAFDAQILDYLFLDSADVFFKTPGEHINMFQIELYNLSIMRALDKKSATKTTASQFEDHRRKILAGFDNIVKASQMTGPVYVHGHILSPHQPFVFDEDGEEVTPDHRYSMWIPIQNGRDPDEYRKQYIAQLRFINKKLIATVKAILENSSIPPIIIIQGDHGPSSELTSIYTFEGNNFSERMPILNAYYFPDQNYGSLYSGISPVNSFRTIFSQYFDLHYPLLADSSYYSPWVFNYNLINVTDSIKVGL